MEKVIKLFPGLIFIIVLASACGNEEVNSNPPGTHPPGDSDSTKNEWVPHLGANFNARLGANFVRFSELKSSGTTWVRGMIPFFQLYKKYKAGKNWYNDPRIQTYKKFQKHGYKTVLAIRYQFRSHNLTIPDKRTERFTDYMQFTDALLKVLLPSTDVIVPGNEPIFEALKEDKQSQRLVAFYAVVARHVHNYIVDNNLDIPLFIGSFTSSYRNKKNNQAFNGLMTFAKKTSWVSGVDIHIHHSNNKTLSRAMDYISNRIRSGQRIILSEFSLVSWWAKHRRDDLSSVFKTKYSPPDSVKKVWQYLNYALQHPRPLQEWNDWNRMTPWLKSRRHYICRAWQIFTSYPKFWIATYSFKLGWPPHFSATDPAWILNSLLVNKTVEHKPDGDAYGRIWYMDDFKAIQEGNPTSCD
jgi:hypothetical protein